MGTTPTYADYLTSASFTLDGVHPDGHGTIRPAVTGQEEHHPVTADALPLVDVSTDGDFVPGDVLGEGGMGVVRVARQAALGREVAVKSLRAGRGSTRARADLLHEARITGRLEHPNVVPVYLLGKHADGQALFVMRRIAGHPWSALLEAPNAHGGLVGDDALGFHVGVLAQVCQAVRFAHEHGIVHRDLKPENVMIGEYGEVYVVDWGIAVALEASDPPLPLARDVKGVAGSPAYLAPEMAMGAGAKLGPWTDVYLLGAILHEVLTGRVRHDGDTLMAMLASAFNSTPVVYPSDVPRPLAELANRAMAVDPTARPTAAAFRRALLDWVAARPALALLVEARARVELAQRRIATRGDPHGLASEARVLLQQARNRLPGDAEVVDELDRLVRAMIAYELGRGEVEAAATWLLDLPAPDEALAASVEGARAARTRDLAALVRAADLTAGAGLRASVMLAEGLGFGAGGVLAYVFGVPAGYWVAWLTVAAVAAVTVPFGLFVWLLPDRQNALTRGLFYNLVFTVFLLVVGFGVAWQFGRPFEEAMALTLVASAGLLGTIATLVDPKAVVGAVFIALGAVFIALWPAGMWLVTGLTTGAGFLAMSAVWALQARRSRAVNAQG